MSNNIAAQSQIGLGSRLRKPTVVKRENTQEIPQDSTQNNQVQLQQPSQQLVQQEQQQQQHTQNQYDDDPYNENFFLNSSNNHEIAQTQSYSQTTYDQDLSQKHSQQKQPLLLTDLQISSTQNVQLQPVPNTTISKTPVINKSSTAEVSKISKIGKGGFSSLQSNISKLSQSQSQAQKQQQQQQQQTNGIPSISKILCQQQQTQQKQDITPKTSSTNVIANQNIQQTSDRNFSNSRMKPPSNYSSNSHQPQQQAQTERNPQQKSSIIMQQQQQTQSPFTRTSQLTKLQSAPKTQEYSNIQERQSTTPLMTQTQTKVNNGNTTQNLNGRVSGLQRPSSLIGQVTQNRTSTLRQPSALNKSHLDKQNPSQIQNGKTQQQLPQQQSTVGQLKPSQMGQGINKIINQQLGQSHSHQQQSQISEQIKNLSQSLTNKSSNILSNKPPIKNEQTVQQNQQIQDRNPFDIAPDAEEILEKAFKISQNFSMHSPPPDKSKMLGQSYGQNQIPNQNQKFGFKSRLTSGGNQTLKSQSNMGINMNNTMMNESVNLSPINQQELEDSPEINKKQFGSTALGRFQRQNRGGGESVLQSAQFLNSHVSLVQQNRETKIHSQYTSVNPLLNEQQQQQQLNQSQIDQQQVKTETSLNRSNVFDNTKLEDKIKELQQNLASLPASFSRPKSKSYYSNNQLQGLYQNQQQQQQNLVNQSQDQHQQQPPPIKSPFLSKQQYLTNNLSQSQNGNYNMQSNQLSNKTHLEYFNDIMDNNLRSSSEADVLLGSTLSTSPDKKSFENNMQFQSNNIQNSINQNSQNSTNYNSIPFNANEQSSKIKILINSQEEEEKKDSQNHMFNNHGLTPTGQFQPSPALRKKISQTRLGVGSLSLNQQSADTLIQKIEEINEEEQEILLESTKQIQEQKKPSFQGSFGHKIQQNNIQNILAQTSISSKSEVQLEPSTNNNINPQQSGRQRQSLTTMYKKQNKLGQTQSMNPSLKEEKKELTFQQQLQLKIEEKMQQQILLEKQQHRSNTIVSNPFNATNNQAEMTSEKINTATVNQQQPLISTRMSLNPCQVTKQQKQSMQLQQTLAQGKLLKIRKKIVRDKIEEGDERQECDHCGRRFMEEAFQKHIVICEKVFIKGRKVFNTQKQRTMDEEHQKFLETAQTKLSYYQIDVKLNDKWKIYSAQFRAAIQSAKTGKTVEGVPDDRIECEFCGRKFAAAPAQKHIPICQKKATDLQNKLKSQKINSQKQALANKKITKLPGKK